jgi:hypothetical protein
LNPRPYLFAEYRIVVRPMLAAVVGIVDRAIMSWR